MSNKHEGACRIKTKVHVEYVVRRKYHLAETGDSSHPAQTPEFIKF